MQYPTQGTILVQASMMCLLLQWASQRTLFYSHSKASNSRWKLVLTGNVYWFIPLAYSVDAKSILALRLI